MDPAQEFELKVFERQKPMNAVIDRFSSPVQQFYCGATVFVTGGSGFLGKQLVEKLFRSAKISKVFLLIRTKKDKSAANRLNDLLADPVFDALREKQPDFVNKIVAIAGDVGDIRLGVDDKDWLTITDEVDIIFHMAATTRFDEPLRAATLVNVRGTRETLLLAKACSKLRSFVHVSTAYAHACEDRVHQEVLEDFYPSPVDPEAIIKIAETADESRLNEATPGLRKGWPNTYSFGKALAEELVRNAGRDLPICVVRPAIVTAAYSEPNPGWVDKSNVYGASGIVTASGLGVIHVLYNKNNNEMSFVPVDYVNNATICAGWETARRWTSGEKKPKVYAVTTARKPLLMGTLGDLLRSEAAKYASDKAIWLASCVHTSNKYLYFVLFWLMHYIPAYLVDAVCYLLGKERRLVKVYTKIYKMTMALGYFMNNYWIFVDQNLQELQDNLDPLDRDIYHFDVTTIDWKEYIALWCIGLRKYIVKDGLNRTKEGVKKQKYLRVINYIVVPLYLYCLFKIFYAFCCILFHIFNVFI